MLKPFLFKQCTLLVLLTVTSSLSPALANILLDTGSGSAYTVRPADDGLGQGVIVANDTTLTAFGFDFFMPDGGNSLFMIWDSTNSTLLYSGRAVFAPASQPGFHMTTALGTFLLSSGNSYFFGLIADAEIDPGYFFPAVDLTQNNISLLTDGNSNYSTFAAPVAVDTGLATIALRLEGTQAMSTDTPEPAAWVTLVTGLALIAASQFAKRT